MSRSVPGPTNSNTVVFGVDDNGRMTGHVRAHPQGGLVEISDTDGCETYPGLAVCVVGNPDPKPAPDPTESGLRQDLNGCLYVDPNSTRKRKVVPAGTRTGISADQTLASATVTIDATLFNADTCWRVCVDVCNAFIDKPEGGNSTVSIPPADVPSVPNTHSHGTVTVTDADPLSVRGGIEIDGHMCETHAANRGDYAPHSGPVCRDVTVPAGAPYNIDVASVVAVSGSVASGGFTASSGELTVIAERVSCPEDC